MTAVFSTNEFVAALLGDASFEAGIMNKISENMKSLLAKADTVTTGTGLVWYDLRPTVQLLYPYEELTPFVSKLPRVAGDGGTGYHWKRVTGINTSNISPGVAEGQRAGRIAITEQDQSALYKTLGLEDSVTFQAVWANGKLDPESRAIATLATLQAVRIQEEQVVIGGNASQALAQPTLSIALNSGASNGVFNAGGGATVYVMVVALTVAGVLGYKAYNSGSGLGGVPGQIVQTQADATSITFGGGSSKPSAEGSQAVTGTQTVTCTATGVPGAVAWAWYVGTSTGTETLAGITQGNRATFTQTGQLGQPVTKLQVSSAYQDNSVNAYVFDGIVPLMFNAVFGSAPGAPMATSSQLPDSRISLLNSGAICLTGATGNAGLTISGTNIAEFDLINQAAYEQYKIDFDTIHMSSADLVGSMGDFFSSGDTSSNYRIMFEASQVDGRVVAGFRVTDYRNKHTGKSTQIRIHPYWPAGKILFAADRVPYRNANIGNLLELHTRQDYYQVQWPWQTMRHEFGVYVDEVLADYFMPAYALIDNLNQVGGVQTF